ncbi:MAG: hypothetical protein ACYCZZ_02925 [Minisyncoccota bacterium]
MRHMRLRVASTIIALIILVGFAISAPHTRDIVETFPPQTAATSTPAVALHDAFRKGLHTITGSIEAPTPCTSLVATATAIGDASSTTGVLLSISMPVDTGVCLQQATTLNFSSTVTAPAGVPITVKVNDFVATTTAL